MANSYLSDADLGIGAPQGGQLMSDEDLGLSAHPKIDMHKSLNQMDTEAVQRNKDERSGPRNAYDTATQGFNLGFASLGAPVDLLNNAATAARDYVSPSSAAQGKVFGDRPFGGSEIIKRGMRNLSMLQPQVNSTNDLPENWRWLGKGAEVVGGTLPYTLGPMAAAGGLTVAGRQLGGMTAAELAAGPRAGLGGALDSAAAEQAANPGAHVSRELGTTFGMAQGAGLAEDLVPDNQGASIAGQVLGGVLQPGATLAKLASGVGGEASKGLRTLTKAGQLKEAANQIVSAMEKEGIDRNAVMANLSRPNEYGVSAAELSDNPTLYGMRQAGNKADPNLASAAEATDQAAQTNIANRIQSSVEPGDTNALTAAAAAERASTLAGNGAAIQKLTSADAYSRAAANNDAGKLLDQSWANGRAAENSLYDNVPKEMPVNGAALKPTIDDLVKNDRLAYSQVPTEIRQEIANIAKPDANPTAGDLMNLRSFILAAKRDAQSGATPNSNLARIYGRIGNGLLDPLESVPGLAEARAASKQFHDTWDRSFASKSQQLTSTGAGQAPGQTLEAAWTAGNPAKRMQQLDDLIQASKPPAFAQSGAHPDLSGQMAQNVENFTRAQAGRMTPGALAKFAADHAPMLEKFPALKQDIQGALAAHQTDLEGTAFARVLKAGEKPTDAISSALKGPNPTADYGNIARLAAKGGPDAVAGLRAATMDHLSKVASGPNGMDFTKLREALMTPQGNSGKSLLDLMQAHGVLNKSQMEALTPVLERGTAREALAANARVPTEPIGGVTDDLIKTGIHAAGARLFSPLGHASHSPLLMASAGSKFAEKFAGAIPAGKVGAHMSEALNSTDPAMLLKMLQTGKVTANMSAADKVRDIAAAMGSNMGVGGPARIPDAAIGLLGRINPN